MNRPSWNAFLSLTLGLAACASPVDDREPTASESLAQEAREPLDEEARAFVSDSCANADLFVTDVVPLTEAFNTAAANADIGLTVLNKVCAGLPIGAGQGDTNRDIVRKFRAPVNATYRITVTLDATFKSAKNGATGAYVYVVDSCSNDIREGCRLGIEVPTGGQWSFTMPLAEEQEIYIVVDGKLNAAGPGTLAIELDRNDGTTAYTDADFGSWGGPGSRRLAPGRSERHAVRLAARHGCNIGTSFRAPGLVDPDGVCSTSLTAANWKRLMRETFDSAVVFAHTLATASQGAAANNAYYPPWAAADPADPQDVTDPPATWPIFAATFGTPMTYERQRLDPVGSFDSYLDSTWRELARRGTETQNQPARPSTRIDPSYWAPEVDPARGVPMLVTRDAGVGFGDGRECLGDSDCAGGICLPPVCDADRSNCKPRICAAPTPDFEVRSFTSVFGAAGGPRYLASADCRSRGDDYYEPAARIGTVMEASPKGAMLDSQVAPGLKWIGLNCRTAACAATHLSDANAWPLRNASGVDVVRGQLTYAQRDRGFERFCTANANAGLDPAGFFPSASDANAARRDQAGLIGAETFTCPAGQVARVRRMATNYWNAASDTTSYGSRASNSEAACFHLDPRKAGAALAMSNSVEDIAGALGARGVITDAWGGSLDRHAGLQGLAGGVDLNTSVALGGKQVALATALQTARIPWYYNGIQYFILSLSTNGFDTPHALASPITPAQYAEAYQSLTQRTRRELSELGTRHEADWLPNFNTSTNFLGHLHNAPQRTFPAWKRLVQATVAPAFWDEKFNEGQVGSGPKRLNYMLRLFAAREASTHGRPAILSALYSTYQTGTAADSLESALANYLLVLDQPTIQLDLFPEVRVVDSKGIASWGPSGQLQSFDAWLRLFGGARGSRSLLRTILDLQPGAAVDAEPRATGPNPNARQSWRDGHALLYRQYGSALVLKNLLPALASGDQSGNILYVTLPNAGTKYTRLIVVPDEVAWSLSLHRTLDDLQPNGNPWFGRETYAGGEIIQLMPEQAVVLFTTEAVDWTRTAPAAPLDRGTADHGRTLFPTIAAPPTTQTVVAVNLQVGSSLNHAALTDDANNDGSPDFDSDNDGLSDMFE